MLKPSRLSLFLSFLITGYALWMMRASAPTAPEPFYPGSLFFQHVNVCDPAQDAIQLDRQLLIVDGVIRRVEAASKELPRLPPHTRVIDGRGKALLPGLIDAATFASLDGSLPEDRRGVDYEGVLRISLQAGATSLAELNACRAQLQNPLLASRFDALPRVRAGGAVLTSPGGWRPGTAGDGASPAVEISSLEDLEAAFKANRDDGASLVLATLEHSANDEAALSPVILRRLGQLCDAAGLPLFIHVEHPSKALAALEAGPDALLGPWASEKASPGLIDAMLKAHCAFAPGLQSVMGFLPPHDILAGLRGMAEPGWISVALGDSLGNWEGMLKVAKGLERQHCSSQLAAENAAALAAAGVPLLMGSFSGLPGLPHGAALRAELGRLVDCGLTPARALKAATMNGAAALKLPLSGRVAPGFAADLLLVEGDPFKDLGALRRPAALIRAGKYWSARELAGR